MSGSLSHAANAEPNLTPILDMVLQLITFFMLVVNFKSAEIDRNMELPIIGSARVQDLTGRSVMMINVNKEGQFTMMGKPYKDADATLWIERDAKREAAFAKRSDPKFDLEKGDELSTLVIIRADKATPYSRLSYIIKACQDNGYRNFAYRYSGPPQK